MGLKRLISLWISVSIGWTLAVQGGESAPEHAPDHVPPLTCVTTTLWPPFNTDIKGELAGIGVDYWRAICDKLGIPFRCLRAESWSDVLDTIRSGEADLTIATQPTEARKRYAVFSKPYAHYPYVIVTRNDIGFIYNVDLLEGRHVVVGRRYAIASILRSKHPAVAFEEVDSIDVALKMVSEGKAFATIDAFPVLSYQLNQHRFSNLKISGSLPETFTSHVMLNKELAALLPAINGAIDRITPAEKKAINARWITPFEKMPSPKTLIYLLMTFLILLTLAVFWIMRLHKAIGYKETDLQKLKEVATIDSLTLIYNRHMLTDLLTRQIAAAERHRFFFSVVFFDIDHFKKVNDRYGHDVGDLVLKELSEIVSHSIRQTDQFGRWGGDEFMIILPQSTTKQTRKLVDKLDERIRQNTFPVVRHVSCSFGISAYEYGDTVDTLMKRVDEELYKAKKNRR